jgi:hypothetical protein
MSVTVTPSSFALVNFDATEIAAITADLAERLGLGGEEIRVEVDETTPLTRSALASADPIVITAESGALENPKQLRSLSKTRTAESIGRLLLRARDRRPGGGFETAPPEGQLSLAQSAAWDSYANGRLARAGLEPHRPRWLYHFRNRHGFTDAADAVFDRLWAADALTWAELDALSAEALAARA